MRKLLIFGERELEAVNKALQTETLEDILIKDGKVYLICRADTGQYGLSTADQVILVDKELRKLMQNRISGELERDHWQSKRLAKTGSPKVQAENEMEVLRLEKQIATCDSQIRQYRTLISMIKSGTFKI